MSIHGRVVATETFRDGQIGVIALAPVDKDPVGQRLLWVEPLTKPLPPIGTVLWGSSTLLIGETPVYKRDGYTTLTEI